MRNLCYKKSLLALSLFGLTPLVMAGTPTIMPDGGTFHLKTAPLSINSPDSSLIYWTTNGTEPECKRTQFSYQWNDGYQMPVSRLIWAVACDSNGNKIGNSKYAMFNIVSTLPKPDITLPGGTYITVTPAISVNDSGIYDATTHYTTNNTAPSCNSTQWTGPFTLDRSRTIRAVTCVNGVLSSESLARYVVQLSDNFSYSPASGTYNYGTPITINNHEPQTEVYYTTNNLTPDKYSQKYYGPLTLLPGNHTVKAVIHRDGSFTDEYIDSEFKTANYTITVPTPIMTPKGGDYNFESPSVWIAGISGTSIHYTSNNTPPNCSSPNWPNGGTVKDTRVIRAVACVGNYSSGEVTGVFNITPDDIKDKDIVFSYGYSTQSRNSKYLKGATSILGHINLGANNSAVVKLIDYSNTYTLPTESGEYKKEGYKKATDYENWPSTGQTNPDFSTKSRIMQMLQTGLDEFDQSEVSERKDGYEQVDENFCVIDSAGTCKPIYTVGNRQDSEGNDNKECSGGTNPGPTCYEYRQYKECPVNTTEVQCKPYIKHTPLRCNIVKQAIDQFIIEPTGSNYDLAGDWFEKCSVTSKGFIGAEPFDTGEKNEAGEPIIHYYYKTKEEYMAVKEAMKAVVNLIDARLEDPSGNESSCDVAPMKMYDDRDDTDPNEFDSDNYGTYSVIERSGLEVLQFQVVFQSRGKQFRLVFKRTDKAMQMFEIKEVSEAGETVTMTVLQDDANDKTVNHRGFAFVSNTKLASLTTLDLLKTSTSNTNGNEFEYMPDQLHGNHYFNRINGEKKDDVDGMFDITYEGKTSILNFKPLAFSRAKVEHFGLDDDLAGYLVPCGQYSAYWVLGDPERFKYCGYALTDNLGDKNPFGLNTFAFDKNAHIYDTEKDNSDLDAAGNIIKHHPERFNPYCSDKAEDLHGHRHYWLGAGPSANGKYERFVMIEYGYNTTGEDQVAVGALHTNSEYKVLNQRPINP